MLIRTNGVMIFIVHTLQELYVRLEVNRFEPSRSTIAAIPETVADTSPIVPRTRIVISTCYCKIIENTFFFLYAIRLTRIIYEIEVYYS